MEFSTLLLCLFVTSSQCQIFSTEQENTITDVVNRAMTCHHVPGLAISVVKGSNTWIRGFGTADRSTGRPVETSTLFATGFLTKAFTMTLLAMLLNDTSYTWSTRLSDIEGVNFTFINENLTREVTLADLLSHKTGLWDVVSFGFVAGYPDGTKTECLSSHLKDIPERSGRSVDIFQYNSMMYLMLGQVIEVLGGDTWENLMASRILKPLGMTSSKVLSSPEDVLFGVVAKPYIRPEGQVIDGTHSLYKISPLEPAAGLLSNADDMAKWVQFNLRNGTAPDGKKLVDPDLFTEAFKNHNTINGYWRNTKINDLTTGYGYAWFTSTYRGIDRIWHDGELFSYVSQIWLFLEHDLGIYISLNGPGIHKRPVDTIKILLSLISDIALDMEPWQNATTACESRYPRNAWLPSSKQAEPTKDEAENIHGTYGNPLLPDITISLGEGAGSAVKLNWNRIIGDLRTTESRDNFELIIKDPWEYAINWRNSDGKHQYIPINFTRNSRKEVEGLNLTLGGSSVMAFKKNVRFVDGCNLSPASVYTEGTYGDPVINTAVRVSASLAMVLAIYLL